MTATKRSDKRKARRKGDDYALLDGMPHLGRYRMISADVPWPHDNYGQAKHGAAKSAYQEMPLEAVCSMPVGELAHEDGAVLLLWCTAAQAADGAHLAVASAWGFRLVTRAFSWVKCAKACAGCGHDWDDHDEPLVTEDAPGLCRKCVESDEPCEMFVVRANRGPGSYSMQGVEDVWLGLRGDGWSQARAERDCPEIVFAPRGAHSKKPDVIQRRAERLWPSATPRLELFARRRLEGWAAYGNELALSDCDLVFGKAIGRHWPTLSQADPIEAAVQPDIWCPLTVTATTETGFAAAAKDGTTRSFLWSDELVTWRRVKR